MIKNLKIKPKNNRGNKVVLICDHKQTYKQRDKAFILQVELKPVTTKQFSNYFFEGLITNVFYGLKNDVFIQKLSLKF